VSASLKTKPERATHRRPDHLAAMVKRNDPDRFLTALFAPSGSRAALLALYAFNYELARIRELVTEPVLGHIRLHWWREAVAGIYAGSTPRHEVAEALAGAVTARRLDRPLLERIIDAREADLDDGPPADLAALLGYAEATAGSLTVLALQAMEVRGTAAERAGRAVGTAYALIGLLRAVPFHARAGRIYLPSTLLDKHAITPRDLPHLAHANRSPPAGVAAAAEEIAVLARLSLAEARSLAAEMPRRAVPALLPATVAQVYLDRLAGAGYDPYAAPAQDRPPGLVWRLALRAWIGRW
jgi:NADH dehydrogenase [ubiquinone] 1 alpha subcomplex assembly factor 6